MPDAPRPCWGTGKSDCATPAVLDTHHRLLNQPMSFCQRHFWLWNAASLRRRGLVKLAGYLKDSADAGVLDGPAPDRATVEAIELRMLI